MSLPMRERGLKLAYRVWRNRRIGVAPHAGAWIETQKSALVLGILKSLPMRERGLKLQTSVHLLSVKGRSPCGSVD